MPCCFDSAEERDSFKAAIEWAVSAKSHVAAFLSKQEVAKKQWETIGMQRVQAEKEEASRLEAELVNARHHNEAFCAAAKPVNGHGRWKYSDGGEYVGEWRGGEKHGRGNCVYPKGGTYEGEWSEDKMHGRGKYVWANGGTYEGEWIEGNMHGRGKRVFANGDTYEGEWSKDKKHGRGKQVRANGDTYEGDYSEDKMHGRGKQVRANGDTYEGDYSEVKMHGRGVATYAVDGKTSLPGLDYSWNAGDRMDCGFKANVRHGACAYTFFNGETLNCTWVDGHCPEFTARQSAVRAASVQAKAAAEAIAAAPAIAHVLQRMQLQVPSPFPQLETLCVVCDVECLLLTAAAAHHACVSERGLD